MSSILQKLIFQKDKTASDGLMQPEREAIVDALHYCMYADSSIALAETKVIADWNETLDWDPNHPFSTYEPRSIAAARQALESMETRMEFILSIVRRMGSEKSSDTLLRLCRKLADADGKRSDGEWAFIEALSNALATAKK
ncbi:putative tellurite resistance protein B-like protein [Ereboglobus sp. PH5-5]|uniref:hypothetical protein n=1 Tax=Ereboglobus sp. PH5-5 TaxID=2940529 RepID=UPI0024067403|nr:hypothetical protein [Ereboglobus sp. PH5-5]MDF9831884.1 putative tellurite resistance protein B-like protein [Ereboglobus sp. PH5-5]